MIHMNTRTTVVIVIYAEYRPNSWMLSAHNFEHSAVLRKNSVLILACLPACACPACRLVVCEVSENPECVRIYYLLGLADKIFSIDNNNRHQHTRIITRLLYFVPTNESANYEYIYIHIFDNIIIVINLNLVQIRNDLENLAASCTDWYATHI